MNDPVQLVQQLATNPSLTRIRQNISAQQILQLAIALQQIPAPTFAEGHRAAHVKTQMEELGLIDVSMDELFNVYGRWPGQQPDAPALLVSAHLDTVFPADTDLSIRYQHNRTYGPGLGDNSLGVASLLSLVQIFRQNDITPPSDIWFVANSREEGLGDLGGIRAVWQRLGSHLSSAIVIEGLGLGRIYHAGVAVRRLHIVCKADGGHSWQHFGRPTAIHGLVELGARITAITPPTSPRTTYNIGLISGGHSVNSLATRAELFLDLRSEQSTILAELEAQVMDAIAELQRPGLTFTTEIVGDRPSGMLDTSHPLVKCAVAALGMIEHEALFETGSTDANVLLANHLPTVTIGIGYGGNSHRLDEYIEADSAPPGLWHLLLLVLAAAELGPNW